MFQFLLLYDGSLLINEGIRAILQYLFFSLIETLSRWVQLEVIILFFKLIDLRGKKSSQFGFVNNASNVKAVFWRASLCCGVIVIFFPVSQFLQRLLWKALIF